LGFLEFTIFWFWEVENMNRWLSAGIALVSLVVVGGYSVVSKAQEPTTVAATPGPESNKPDQRKFVEIITSQGSIILLLESEKAPVSVQNFLEYVEKGHYEGTVFHRVIKDFMIQGGGFPATNLRKEKSTGPGIKNEGGNGLSNQRYTVAMARTGDPNSATAQFFINTNNNNDLDRKKSQDGYGYAVFAKVVKGIDVVDKIASVPVRASANGPPGDGPSEPVTPVIIQKIQVVVPVASPPVVTAP